MKGVPFYRLMGFVIDKRCRSRGIGSYALEKTITQNVFVSNTFFAKPPPWKETMIII